MTGAVVDGAVRMFAPAPSVATITYPATGGADGDGAGSGDANVIGEAAGLDAGGGAAESVGGAPLASSALAGRPSTPTRAPSSGHSTGGRVPQAPTNMADASASRTMLTITICRRDDGLLMTIRTGDGMNRAVTRVPPRQSPDPLPASTNHLAPPTVCRLNEEHEGIAHGKPRPCWSGLDRSRWSDSNRRPAAYEAAALPLSYIGRQRCRLRTTRLKNTRAAGLAASDSIRRRGSR